MDQEALQSFLGQALALANNYNHTGRPNKAVEVAAQVKKVSPHNPVADLIIYCASTPQIEYWPVQIKEYFGEYWLGQSLEGKSIEVFCDQGMGDTINLLRYLAEMKRRWNCQIVLNCYAFYRQFKRLMESISYIDEFVAMHKKCDFHTNIMSIPALLSGLKFDIYYPVHWREVLGTFVPKQSPLPVFGKMFESDGFKIGLAWKSNPENGLYHEKTVPDGDIAVLENGNWQLYQIIPDTERYNFVTQIQLSDLVDTMRLIDSLDVVVSIDTVTLHLAGAMGKKTLGLLCYNADPRWGMGNSTIWYPSVELFRQPKNRDWRIPIGQVKERLESLFVVS
jgi:hypothetical protein